jgi:hypothetical protein
MPSVGKVSHTCPQAYLIRAIKQEFYSKEGGDYIIV